MSMYNQNGYALSYPDGSLAGRAGDTVFEAVEFQDVWFEPSESGLQAFIAGSNPHDLRVVAVYLTVMTD